MDLQDKAAFGDKLRKLAMDGSKRFEGFQYDVEADIEKFVDIAQQVEAASALLLKKVLSCHWRLLFCSYSTEFRAGMICSCQLH